MRAIRLGSVLALALACACGGSAQPVVNDAAKAKVATPKKAGPEVLPPLPAFPLAQAKEGTFGPYLGRSGDRALALWAVPTERGHRWMSLLLDAKGEPQGNVRDAGAAPELAPRAIVRPFAGGFIATYTHPAGLSSAVSTLVFSKNGEPLGDSNLVTHSPDPVLYADVVSLDGGSVLFYAAEKSGGDRAEIVALPLGKDGRPRGSGSVLAGDAWAWQPVSLGETGALGLVTQGSKVAMVRFDAEGRALGKRLLVSDSPTAAPDLDAVRIGDRLVFAWTDRREIDARVMVAAADSEGKLVVSPRAPITPRGGQALVGLLPPMSYDDGRALLSWEDLDEPPTHPSLHPHERAMRLGLLNQDGLLLSRTATLISADDHGEPELASADDGWAALTLAPACLAGESCAGAERLPTMVRFDRDLGVLASEPLTIGPLNASPPAMAWGLSCGGGHCTALVSGEGIPAPVFALGLEARKGPHAKAAWLDRLPEAPRKLAFDALVEGDRIAHMVSTQLSGGSLVAWITYFGEEELDPKGKVTEAAKVFVSPLDERGEPREEPVSISVRAASVGGVSIAKRPSDDEALLVWAGHDAGQHQVFATRLDAGGKKLGQQMITRTKGGVADVAVAWAGDGWALAWIDYRHDNGEVYVTKLDRQLKRVLPERRLTTAEGDASGVQILARGEELWVAYADARGDDGAAEPYTRRLSLRDLQPIGEELRVARSSSRAHSLQLATIGDDPMLAFIEDGGDLGASAKLLRLDARGSGLGAPVSLPLGARPTSLALRCDAGACRGIVSVEAEVGELRLDAFTFDGQRGLGKSRQVLRLLGSSSADASPSIVGDWLYFADDSFTGTGKVRRMRMAWE